MFFCFTVWANETLKHLYYQTKIMYDNAKIYVLSYNNTTQCPKIRVKIHRLTRRVSMAQMIVPGMGLTERVVKEFFIRAFFVYRPPKFGKSVIFDPKNTI